MRLEIRNDQSKALGAAGIRSLLKTGGTVYESNHILCAHESDIRL